MTGDGTAPGGDDVGGTHVAAAVYALGAYAAFLAVMVWSIAFLADLGPSGVDHGAAVAPARAVAVDALLVAVFALHHSVMARPAAKRRFARVLRPRIERSTYVLVASALLALVLWGWLPIPALVWDVRAEPWRTLLWGGFALGWAIAVASTFMIDHFDFVGLRQATGRSREAVFQARWLYAYVRHPLMLGLLIGLWVTPTLTWGHALFAGLFSIYIAIGVRFEERDLRSTLGEPYRRYAERTPAIVPGLGGMRRRRSPVRRLP